MEHPIIHEQSRNEESHSKQQHEDKQFVHGPAHETPSTGSMGSTVITAKSTIQNRLSCLAKPETAGLLKA